MVVRHDRVVAALHVSDGCHGAVVVGQVGASATGVVVVEPEAMCPTIVHVESVVGYDGPHAG